MTNLYNTNSPLTREERQNQNRTWQDILARFSEVHRQIRILAGGTEVDELLQRIEDTITQAQLDVQNSIAANDAAVANALNNVSVQLNLLTQKINEANTAIVGANTAIVGANTARDSALQAVADLQALIDSYNHRGEYSAFVQYYKNNEVLFLGSTYRAKRDNMTVSPPTTLGESNDDWQLIARRGTDAATENIRIWRGTNPPVNSSTLLWFEDPDMAVGQEIVIYGGVAVPTDSLALWLQEGGS